MKKVDLQLVAEGIISPIGVVAVPDEIGRRFMINQIGKVETVNGSGEKLEEPFLDVSSKMVTLGTRYDDRGLLGLAFHPDYDSNGRLFDYTLPS